MSRFFLLAVCSVSLSLFSASVKIPSELEWSMFADSDVAACPAALSAHPDGSVFVGIDKNGSLGKGAGKGWILKLIDENNDGKFDKSTKFASLESVRGLMAVGDKLYVLHSTWQGAKYDTCYLSVLEDKNNDGIADGDFKVLVKGMSTATHNASRGVDHSTNGIRMGIDGWIYIAMGDFGIVGAQGTDGTKLTVLGGGVIRVRPDGTELEEYVHGLRNICDVAIDPYMNLFTRGNTNDGGGWNIRFIHEIQSGEYGYPKLFKRYTNEILPALVDLGGGSGMGSMYFDEPNWPEKYSNVPLMGDWGRSHVYIHRLKVDGASFTQKEEEYISVGKMTDIDVDGSGRMYVSSWEGSGFNGGNGGYVVRIVPKGWTYKPFPNLAKASDADLISYLKAPSATWRFHASQEIVNSKRPLESQLFDLINDKSALLQSRVAAIFTVKQLSGVKANDGLFKAANDQTVKEWALRAIADRIPQNKGVDIKPFVAALKNSSEPRIQVAASVGLGRIGNLEAAADLIEVAEYEPANTKSGKNDEKGFSGNAAYVSKTVKGNGSEKFDIDILGWKGLNIVVLPSPGGSSNDVAIIDPVLVTKDGKKVKLTELKLTAGKDKPMFKIDKNLKGEALKAADKDLMINFGFGTKTGDKMSWKLDPQLYSRLQGTLALSAPGKGEFIVVIDKNAIQMPSTKDIPEGPHASPNSKIIVPHVAVKALIKMRATKACLEAVGKDKSYGAYWAMRYIHDTGMVDELAAKLATVSDDQVNKEILAVLVRLYNDEIPYDGSWWWQTRPDTRGPYYKPTAWAGTEKIAKVLKDYWQKADDAKKAELAAMMNYDRVVIDGIDTQKFANQETAAVSEDPKVDLQKVLNQKGQIGKMSVEDILLALEKTKGDISKGEALFTQQGCIVCHSYKNDQIQKGPFMGAVGGILKREEIAMAILRPNDSISQGFRSYMVAMNDGTVHSGFITAEQDGVLTVRNIAGIEVKLKVSDIKQRTELPNSMMPEQLASGLSVADFANLVDWLHSMK